MSKSLSRISSVIRQFPARVLPIVVLALTTLGAEAQDTIPAGVSDPDDRPAVTSPVARRGDRRVNTATVLDPDTIVFAGDTAAIRQRRDRVTVVAPPEAGEPAENAGNTEIKVFNPDPKRALWLSAICPGLGQIYNRRYWKLPIIVGAYVGLGYGTAWNNRMLGDYNKAYRDIMDNDPNTRSYMNFYPPTVDESSIDKTWLQKALRNKRDYYRRYRDICIIAMVGVYLINIIDAYVDASLAHFDISPDLSLRVRPSVINSNEITPGTLRTATYGLGCSLNF